MFWVFPLGFILFGTLWVSWTCVIISFPNLEKFSTIISGIFSWSFFLSSSSGTPMIQMLGHLALSQMSLRLSSFLLILFLFVCFPSLFHWVLPFYHLPHLSYLLPLLSYSWFPPVCVFFFFISLIALFIIYWFFFISSRSLLNLSCIFPILVSRSFICNSFLFSRF